MIEMLYVFIENVYQEITILVPMVFVTLYFLYLLSSRRIDFVMKPLIILVYLGLLVGVNNFVFEPSDPKAVEYFSKIKCSSEYQDVEKKFKAFYDYDKRLTKLEEEYLRQEYIGCILENSQDKQAPIAKMSYKINLVGRQVKNDGYELQKSVNPDRMQYNH